MFKTQTSQDTVHSVDITCWCQLWLETSERTAQDIVFPVNVTRWKIRLWIQRPWRLWRSCSSSMPPRTSGQRQPMSGRRQPASDRQVTECWQWVCHDCTKWFYLSRQVTSTIIAETVCFVQEWSHEQKNLWKNLNFAYFRHFDNFGQCPWSVTNILFRHDATTSFQKQAPRINGNQRRSAL